MGDDAGVPGLAITRDPGRREAWAVVHAPSRTAVIFNLAGPATAQLAAGDLGDLPDVDWTQSAERVADVADLLLYVGPAVERIAVKHDGATLGRGLAVYAAGGI